MHYHGDMSLKGRVVWLLMFGVLCGASTGCSTDTGGELPGSPGLPTGSGSRLTVEGMPSGDEGIPTLEAFGQDRTLTIVTWGSSSCPTVPSVDDIDEVANVAWVSLARSDGDPCTADSAARTFELPVDMDASALTVRIMNGES